MEFKHIKPDIRHTYIVEFTQDEVVAALEAVIEKAGASPIPAGRRFVLAPSERGVEETLWAMVAYVDQEGGA